jgi:hypothetical protein
MTAQSTVLAGRAAAESLMVDGCTIDRIGPVITDRVTGAVTASRNRLYDGKCKIQTSSSSSNQESRPESGGHDFTVQRYRVDVPVEGYDPQVGDVVTIMSAALDMFLVGREFRVVSLLHKSYATAYRLSITDEVI